MIFQPELIHKVLHGHKWQTRRPVKRRRVDGQLIPRPCFYEIGRVYSIQPGRGKPGAGRIRIVDRRREPLGLITTEDARAEGFRTVAEFAAYWMTMHDRMWPPKEPRPCTVCDGEQAIIQNEAGEWVECPRCDMGTITPELEQRPARVLDRFHRKHAHRLVWVLTFEVTDQRFLGAKPPLALPGVDARDQGSDEARGYTTNPASALPGEGEAPSDLDLARQRKRSEDRWAAFKEQRLQEAQEKRRQILLSQRIIACKNAARSNHVDVSSYLRIVRKYIREGRSDASINTAIEKAEAIAYRDAA